MYVLESIKLIFNNFHHNEKKCGNPSNLKDTPIAWAEYLQLFFIQQDIFPDKT